MKQLEKSKQTFVNREEIIRWGCIQCRISKDLISKALASQSSQSSAKVATSEKSIWMAEENMKKWKKHIYIEWKDEKKRRMYEIHMIWWFTNRRLL